MAASLSVRVGSLLHNVVAVPRRILLQIAGARGGALGMLQTIMAQVGITAVNVATGVITARLLGPSGRGEFAAATMWFLLPSLLAMAGLQSGVVYQARRDPDRAASIGAAGWLLGLGVYVPAALLCLIALPSLMHAYSPAVVMMARLGTVAAVLNVGIMVARQILLGTRNMHLFNLSTAASPVAYLILLLAILPFRTLTPGIAVLALVVATAIALVPSVWWSMRRWHWRQVQLLPALRPLALYSLRAAPIDLVTVFYWHIDRLVLIGLVAPAQFGYYAVAISFARMIGVLQNAVSSVTLADLASKGAPEIEAYVHRTVRMLFWLLLAACIVGWLGGGIMLRLVYGEGFLPAVPIFRIMLLESSGSCLAQILVEAFLASGRPSYPSIVQGAYCVLLLGAMLLLAPIWGGLGAAVAMLVAMTAKLLFLLLGLRRIGLGFPGLLPQRADLHSARRLLRGGANPSRAQ